MNRITVPLCHSLLCGNSVGACFLYTRKIYETIGEYDTSCFLAEDYDYWLRIGKQFQIGLIEEILYCYRMHAQSLTGKRLAEIKSLDTELKRKYWKDYHLSLSSKERTSTLIRIVVLNEIDSYEQLEHFFPEGLGFLKDRLIMRDYFLKLRYPIYKKLRSCFRPIRLFKKICRKIKRSIKQFKGNFSTSTK